MTYETNTAISFTFKLLNWLVCQKLLIYLFVWEQQYHSFGVVFSCAIFIFAPFVAVFLASPNPISDTLLCSLARLQCFLQDRNTVGF